MAMTAAYRNGSSGLADKLIELHLPLADIEAAKFARGNPGKYPDIQAQAYLGVVQAVRWAPERMKDNNISPYVRVTIRRFIREYLQQDHLIAVPKNKWKQMLDALKLDELEPHERDKAIRDMRSKFIVYQASMLSEDGVFIEDFGAALEMRLAVKDNDAPSYRELVSMLRLSANERVILEMRAANFTLHEIGAAIHKSHVTVLKTIKQVQQRYVGLWRAHPTMPKPPKEWWNVSPFNRG